MKRIRRSRIWCRTVLLGSLAVWLTSCHRWVPVEQPEATLRQAAMRGESNTYRVYLASGETVQGKMVAATRDSLIIETSDRTGCCSGAAETASVAVAGDAVARAQVKETKVLATVFLTVGLVAAPFLAIGIALGISCAGDEKCLS